MWNEIVGSYFWSQLIIMRPHRIWHDSPWKTNCFLCWVNFSYVNNISFEIDLKSSIYHSDKEKGTLCIVAAFWWVSEGRREKQRPDKKGLSITVITPPLNIRFIGGTGTFSHTFPILRATNTGIVPTKKIALDSRYYSQWYLPYSHHHQVCTSLATPQTL